MITVFLGPSLPRSEACELLPGAHFLPPVQQGDVLRVLGARDHEARTPDGVGDRHVIAIVDGYFELVPAVWHKEILVALQSGVGVYGASSMGALRAAELHRYGMVGVGRVFEWFRDGVLEDDDEVAVTHGPDDSGWRPLSTAMVDLRHAYALAAEQGVVRAATAERLTELGKARFYPQRSHAAVLDDAEAEGIDTGELDALRQWLGTTPPSLKADDARALLSGLAQGSLPPSPPGRVARVEETVFLDQLRTEVAQSIGPAAPGAPGGLDAVAERVGESAAVIRKKAALRLFARREAERSGLEPTPAELREAAERFRRQSGLWHHDQTVAWSHAEGITDAIWTAFLRDAVLVEKLQRVHGRELERLAADHARLSTGRLYGTPEP